MAIALLTLVVIGTATLLATTLLGYVGPHGAPWMRQHFLWSLASTFLLVMGHSFVMFFLLATGVEMKNLEKAAGAGDSFRRRTVAMKAQVFPPMTFALLLVVINFMMGAAAHTRAVPRWLHEGLAWLTLVTCLLALYREYRALGDNNRLIAEAASLRKDTSASEA